MKTLHDSITDFTRIASDFIASDIFRRGKFVVYTEDEVINANPGIAFTPELIAWYTTAAPIDPLIETFGDELWLYNPLNIRINQAGYRWIPDESGETMIENIDLWDRNWLVIGEIGGDPIIAHIDQAGTPISIAKHGMGDWQPQIVAKDLGAFLDLLSFWMHYFLLEGQDFNSLYDEDNYLLPDVAPRLVEKLSEFNDEKYVDNIMRSFGLEWWKSSE